MRIISTEAWVLYAGNGSDCPGELAREQIEFDFESEDDVLVEPIIGCWEGNMHHAVTRDPVDICKERKENKIVLGNSGVVRVLETGKNVTNCKAGDLCIVFCNSISDKHGYPMRIYAYDSPNTIGILSKITKISKSCLIPIPSDSIFSLQQWAAFSLRFITAWANWKVAFRCWLSQMEDAKISDEFVVAWGGGVSFAELMLAKNAGFKVAMITSLDTRANAIKQNGIIPIGRHQFPDLNFDPDKYLNNERYKSKYKLSEAAFLKTIADSTENKGVAIFIDNIGLSVYRATLKGLSRQGVITTSGWKLGMELSHLRAIEGINRHIHVHTHYAKYREAIEAMDYAAQNNWMPDIANETTYSWDEIPRLCNEYSLGQISTFYPLYQINPL